MQKFVKPLVLSLVRKYSQPAAKIHLSGIDAAPVVSRLPNGLTVASLENGSPSTKIGIFVNIGSRYESRDNEGISHLVKNSYNLTSGDISGFKLTRELQQIGASLSCTLTREHIFLNLECLRDVVPECLDCIADIFHSPRFHPWELKSALSLCKIDHENISDTPAIAAMDAIHKAAYRDGLGRGLVMPTHRLGSHSSSDCLAFVSDKYVPANMAIAAVGVDNDVLTKAIRSSFGITKKDVETTSAAVPTPSVYHGGELRLDNNSPLVHFCVAAEGAALNDKRMLPLAVLQKALGSGPCIKYSDHLSTVLGAAAAAVTDNPFAVNTINVNYTDSGLIGYYVISHASDVRKIALAFSDVLRKISTGMINEEDVLRGKNQLKSALLFDLEDSTNLVNDMGVQALMTGKYMDSEDIVAAIDAITLDDVLAAASGIQTSNLSMASVGKLHDTPFVDELK